MLIGQYMQKRKYKNYNLSQFFIQKLTLFFFAWKMVAFKKPYVTEVILYWSLHWQSSLLVLSIY